MDAELTIKTTDLGKTVSPVSYSDQYEGLKPPKEGDVFVLLQPSTPVRADKELAAINKAQDGAELGTVAYFGHPMEVVEVGEGGYAAIRLPVHGGDPSADANFRLAVEKHKLQELLAPEEAARYLNGDDLHVVVGSGVQVQDLSNGAVCNLEFGARLPGLDVDGGFSIGTREFQLVSGLGALGEVRSEGVTFAELVRRVSAFHPNFMWGMNATSFSDASGWIQNLYASFGVHLPHNTRRMEAALRNGGEIGTEVKSFADLVTGDVLFLGLKTGGISYMGMFERDQDGRACMRHCRGKGGWQGSYLNSETDIQGFSGFEIKAAWRLMNFER